MDKNAIRQKLGEYCARYDSNNKAAASLKVSAGTVSQILNNEWAKIGGKMWRNIASQVGYTEPDAEWVDIDTACYKELTNCLKKAQTGRAMVGITGDAGTGKTKTIKRFKGDSSNKHVSHIQCCAHFGRRLFLEELLRALGKKDTGLTFPAMHKEIVRIINTEPSHDHLIILDEADKLPDPSLNYLLTLHNALEDDLGNINCGIVLIATDHLKIRIDKGVKNNKMGFKEIYSRLGKKIIELEKSNEIDMKTIFIENGIEYNGKNKGQINEEIATCGGDLRRIKRKILAMKLDARDREQEQEQETEN